jgi:hypothetical protein
MAEGAYRPVVRGPRATARQRIHFGGGVTEKLSELLVCFARQEAPKGLRLAG